MHGGVASCLPPLAFALPLDIVVVELRQDVLALRCCLCILYSSTASSTASTNLFSSFT
jgi:hypothetical protein